MAKNTFIISFTRIRGFLTRELDFFIKSEVRHLEDLDTSSRPVWETYLAKVKAIKARGKGYHRFPVQIEDFQKKLWPQKIRGGDQLVHHAGQDR